MRPERSAGRSPLFQVWFELQPKATERHAVQGLELVALPVPTGTAMFDLMLLIEEGDDGLLCRLEYNRDLQNSLNYSIAGVPPGDYTVEVWQEKLGTDDQKASVKDGATATTNFTMKPKG